MTQSTFSTNRFFFPNMPIKKQNLKALGYSRKIGFQVDADFFESLAELTSVTDAVKRFDGMGALELWKDPQGHYHWATCATLSKKEISEHKRMVLTANQVLLVPDVKAAFSEWKKKKTDELPTKLCGFRIPQCLIDAQDKPKKVRTPKKEEDDDKAPKPAKVKAEPKKKADNPAAELSKQSVAALASMDVDDVNLDAGKKINLEEFAMPASIELDTSKEFAAHLQVLHLLSILEDSDNQPETMMNRIQGFVINYRQSETGTSKKTMVKWAKTQDPDFSGLLFGFGLSVLNSYKAKVVSPFVDGANEKLKEIHTLYEELQAKIKSSAAFTNQLKADKERLADDLQSLLAKNRMLETQLEQKTGEIASLYKQLDEAKNKEEQDEKKKKEDELSQVLNDSSQTVISSSGGYRKRNEASPVKKSYSGVMMAHDSDDEEEEEVASGSLSKKMDDDMDVSKPVASPAKSKKRTFGDSDDEDEKKKSLPAPKKPTKVEESDDEDDLFAKKPAPSHAVSKVTAEIKKIGKAMMFDSDDDDDMAFAKSSKPAAKPKIHASKILLGDDDD